MLSGVIVVVTRPITCICPFIQCSLAVVFDSHDFTVREPLPVGIASATVATITELSGYVLGTCMNSQVVILKV